MSDGGGTQHGWWLQWHITADGTVIRRRSKGSEAHEQVYARYATKRRPDIADLDALDGRVAAHQARWRSAVALPLMGVVAVLAVIAVTGVVLLNTDGSEALATVLLLAGALGAVATAGVLILLARRHQTREEELYTGIGLRSAQWETMGAREASRLIAKPGGVSGEPVHVDTI